MARAQKRIYCFAKSLSPRIVRQLFLAPLWQPTFYPRPDPEERRVPVPNYETTRETCSTLRNLSKRVIAISQYTRFSA